VDVLVAVRPGDSIAAALLAAVATVAAEPPTVVHTSAETELALRSRSRDLLVIDPDVSGPAASALADDAAPPVVAWLSAPSSVRAAELLDAGVDDVLDPSMSAAELVARLRRVARRRSGGVMAKPAKIGALRVDARLREAHWRDRPLALTPREMEVLQVLVAAAGRPVPRELVYRQVWRWAMPRGDRTVDVNVKRLRDKLADAQIPVEIRTQPGIGYRITVRDTDPVVTGL
jgi:DNA-binding response OmpR family regulator